jgi:hypothetical protein
MSTLRPPLQSLRWAVAVSSFDTLPRLPPGSAAASSEIAVPTLRATWADPPGNRMVRHLFASVDTA